MRAIVAIALVMFATIGSASDSRVPVAYSNIARAVGVPETILFAIALQESRLALGDVTAPWPWTLNVDGKPLRLANREAMAMAIESATEKGARFIDVGLMQINLHWWGHRFTSREALLDPYRNIRIGAEILLEQHKDCGDWWCAVGHYHSRTPERAARYREGVRRWHALLKS